MYFKNSNEFIENSVHIGHRKSSLHSNMRENVLKHSSIINLIDINKTLECLKDIEDFINNEQELRPLFLCLKNSTKVICDFIYDNGFSVMQNWPKGFLTNYDIVSNNIAEFNTLKSLDKIKEVKQKRRLSKLNRYFGKVRLDKIPNLLILTDQFYCLDAIKEANKMNINTICIVDSNMDPNLVTYPIFGNDDMESSVKCLISKIILILKMKEKFVIQNE